MIKRPFAVIRGLLWVMILLDLVAIAGSLLQLGGSATNRFDVLPGPQTERTLAAGLRIETLGVRIEDPSGAQKVFDLLAGQLPFALATLPMLWLALRLLGRIAATQPFTEATAAALRRLGAIVFVVGISAETVRGIGTFLLQASVVGSDRRAVGLDFTFSYWWLLLSLLLFAFAQIIAYGCRLRAELDEVI